MHRGFINKRHVRWTRSIVSIGIGFCAGSWGVAGATPLPSAVPDLSSCAYSANLTRVSVADAAQIVVPVAYSKPYVVSDAVINSKKVLDLALCGDAVSFRRQVEEAFSMVGILVNPRSDLVEVDLAPVIHPVTPPPDLVVYRPIYRPAGALASLLGSFAVSGGQPEAMSVGASAAEPGVSGEGLSPGGAGSSGGEGLAAPGGAVLPSGGGASGSQDELLLTVPSGRKAAVLDALSQLDVPVRSVTVRAAVFETGSSKSKTSFFGGIINVLKSALNVSVDVTAPAAAVPSAVINLGSGSIQAAIQAVAESGSYRIVTDPTLTAASGASASFTVGAQVPVLGSVAYEGTGSTPVQNVSYVNTGINVAVQPIVLRDGIFLNLAESISEAESTTSGVDQTPTLSSRSILSSLFLHDRQLILLGGVLQTDTSSDRTGLSFIPLPLGADSSSTGLQVAVLLEVDIDGGSDADGPGGGS